MIKLSTGQPSTLGSYRSMSVLFFGENSDQVLFLDKKISESPNGADEEVIAEESQMLYLLAHLGPGPTSLEDML